jgi:hypothetical protein
VTNDLGRRLNNAVSLLSLQGNGVFFFGDFFQQGDVDALYSKLINGNRPPWGWPILRRRYASEFVSNYLKEQLMFCGDLSDIGVLPVLEQRAENPIYCATLLSSRSFREAFLVLQLRAIAELRAEAESDLRATRKWEARLDTLSKYLDVAEDSWHAYLQLFKLLRISDRHPLYATNYTLLPTQNAALCLRNPIEQIIVDSTKTPSLIHRLLPRDFERYIAKIWESFGFEVNLTASTRDGGADILCLSSRLGVPLKVAIEVKRYAPDRPVSVELVRGFVGANAAIRANKLVYVTSSHYTSDAKNFVLDAGLAHILELRALPDVIRWAQEFERITLHEQRHAFAISPRL